MSLPLSSCDDCNRLTAGHCVAHQPGVADVMAVHQGQVPAWAWTASRPGECEHCYCILDDLARPNVPHRKCCKCLALMAEQFIPALRNEHPTKDGDA